MVSQIMHNSTVWSTAFPRIVEIITGRMWSTGGRWISPHGWPVMREMFPCDDAIIINSLVPGRPRCHFKTAIFNLVLLIGIFTSSKDNAMRWMPKALTNDKSTLVQVMAWCRQATSHCLSQSWPMSMSPYGVTRPQWVNSHVSCSNME